MSARLMEDFNRGVSSVIGAHNMTPCQGVWVRYTFRFV
jgi:hypothetical protein